MGNADETLVVIWSSADKEVARNMAFMYTYNAKKKGWWENVIFIIWGPSAKLLAEDTQLQHLLKNMKDMGITLEACKSCSDDYGVSEVLERMSVDVKYMGVPLTDYLKQGMHVLTF